MTKRILVIDDELEIRNTLSEILREEGYDTDLAESGETAIVKVQEKKYDIALMDYRLGSLNGYETYKEIKKVSPQTKGIVITAYLEDAVNDDFHLEGVDYCFSKPFSNERLLAVIKNM